MSAPRYYLEENFSGYREVFLQKGKEKQKFLAGDVLIYPHTTWDRIYYVLSGKVKISIVEEEMEKDLAFCGADYLFPFITAQDDPLQNLIQIEAVTELEVVSVSREQWEAILKEYPGLKEEMYQMLLDYVYLLAHELESQTFDSGMEKVASFLYTVYENTASEMIHIPMNSLRSFIGLNRTNLNKYMNVLIADGIIQKTNRSIVILQPEKLKTYCSMRIIHCKIVPTGQTEIQPAKYDFKQKLVHEMHDFLSGHFREQEDISKYLDSLPVDRGYLNRLFKLQYDVTIRAFVLEKRLNYAAELLARTDRKIVDIAYKAGFNSVSGFYRSFKENLGISPSDYRKRNL